MKWGKMDHPPEPEEVNRAWHTCGGTIIDLGKSCASCENLRKSRKKIFCRFSGERRVPTQDICDFYQSSLK
jgi:hypothetical protein